MSTAHELRTNCAELRGARGAREAVRHHPRDGDAGVWRRAAGAAGERVDRPLEEEGHAREQPTHHVHHHVAQKPLGQLVEHLAVTA